MIRKLAALAALIALACPTLATTQILPVYVKHPAVKQVVCDHGLGTAFRIGPSTFVTAAHVSENAGCEIEDLPIVKVYTDKGRDFAVVSTSATGATLEYSCRGYEAGKLYFSIGYAKGFPRQRLIVLMAIKGDSLTLFNRGLHTLTGPQTVIPGMSGGPILDSEGRAVGIVNAYNPFFGTSHSREFKGSYLCS